MGQTSIIGFAGGAAIFVFAIVRFLRSKDDPREPPTVTSSIPFIGHIFGMFRHQVFYYSRLRRRTKAPIFALDMPGSKIYVISSPSLIAPVQRLIKPLAFAPLVVKFTQRICGCSTEANEIINRDLLGSESYVGTFFKAMLPPLTPGSALDAMNQIMLENIADAVNALPKEPTRINLASWLRHHITLATTNSTYGPGNPFLDPSVETAFWTFEKNTLSLLVNVLPSITARTASHARTAVGKAFNDYFKKDQHRKGSSLVQARYDHSRRYKVAVEDIARFEVGGAIAILVNTYPAAFWMINYVFSNPTVLEECRAELQNVTRTTTESDGTTVHCIDMDSVKKSCPILASTFQEVLRHRSVGLSVREVMEDTLLDGKYLLKKGGITMISADLLHSDVAVWGEDLASFDHHRFLKGTSKKVPNPVAFRAFGGGSTLCPGRHFATVEVMALASILISRFDIVPVGGVWSNTEVRDVKLWAQIVDADATLEVELSERKIYGGHHVWKLGLTNPKLLFAMAAEDID